MNPVLTDGPAYPFVALDARKAELRAQGKRLFDFTIGDPLEPTPPFVREAMIAAIPEVSQYPTVAGKPSLRKAIADYVQRRFAVTIDPDTELLPCAGAKEAVFHLPLAVIDRASSRTAVVWGEPSYPVYERGAAYAGAERAPVTLTAARGFRLEPDELPEELLRRTALLWINYPHNPTGATIDRAYLERVAAASKQYGFLVASDETYADLYWGGPPPSLLEVTKENVLVIHSLSKRSGMTGYRSGFMAGDAKLIQALRKMRPSVGVASPEFVQAAAEAAWNDDAHVEARRKVFSEKRRRLVSLCDELGLEVLDSGGGLYVWFRAPSDDSKGYCQKLLESGLVLTPGESFGPAGAGWVRAALVPKLDELEEALGAWRRAHAG